MCGRIISYVWPLDAAVVENDTLEPEERDADDHARDNTLCGVDVGVSLDDTEYVLFRGGAALGGPFGPVR